MPPPPDGVGLLGVGFGAGGWGVGAPGDQLQPSLPQKGKQEKPLLSAQQASQGPVAMFSQVPLHGAH